MDIVRDTALKVVYNVLEKDAYANIALDKQLKRSSFAPLERRFLTELSYGTIRSKNTLQWILDKFVSKKKIHPWIKCILYTGIYQIFFMEKVPESAACNESVELAKKYGNKGSVKFVNGVLRNVVRKKEDIKFPDIKTDPIKAISLKYYHPEWMVDRWFKKFGVEDTIKLCQYNNTPSFLILRTNTLKTSRNKLREELLAEGIDTKESAYIPESLVVTSMAEGLSKSKAFNEGKFLIQDEASQLVARIVAPEKKSFIIDGCAAPGGKTTHMAALVEDDATIKAFDIHPHKIKLIKENCQKLGITCVDAKVKDATTLGELYQNKADFLLLDVPCTGMGVLKRPDARWKKKEKDITKISRLQREIIENAATCVKKGGVLVYSTCSINDEENIEVIQSFLSKNPSFKLESILPYLPESILKDDRDKQNAQKGYIQLLPQIHNCDGFFISRMRKI